MRKFLLAAIAALLPAVAFGTDTITVDHPVAGDFEIHDNATATAQVSQSIYQGSIDGESVVIGVGMQVSDDTNEYPKARIDAGSSDEDVWVRVKLSWRIRYRNGATAPPTKWHSTTGWDHAYSFPRHFDKDNLTVTGEISDNFEVYGSVTVSPKFGAFDVDLGDPIATIEMKMITQYSTVGTSGPWTDKQNEKNLNIEVEYEEGSGQ